MAETLLTLSSIKLFGRLISNLSYTSDINTSGNNNLLQSQFVTKVFNVTGNTNAGRNSITNVAPTTNGLQPGMAIAGAGIPAGAFIIQYPEVSPITLSFTISADATATANNVPIIATLQPKFARIYSFTYEGVYYPLARPTIFLVHGVGQAVGNWQFNSSTLDQSGVIAREWDFSNPSPTAPDLVFWEYEKGDFSLRLDTEAGPFEQILLMAALRASANSADRSRSGMQLSGMQLSGMQLSGMQLGVNPNSRNGR